MTTGYDGQGLSARRLTEFFEKLRKSTELDYEVLVVVNNTTDKTFDIVNDFSKKNKRIKALNLLRRGKGYAITEGFREVLKRDNDLKQRLFIVRVRLRDYTRMNIFFR